MHCALSTRAPATGRLAPTWPASSWCCRRCSTRPSSASSHCPTSASWGSPPSATRRSGTFRPGSSPTSRRPCCTPWNPWGLPLAVWQRSGFPTSAGPLGPFEGVIFFFTFPLERDASVTANAHVLEVLQVAPPFPRQQVIQQKVVKYLRDARVDGDHWVDKWHGSPFYATAHAVFALTASAPDLCQPAFTWFSKSQREDGSWGCFNQGTPEETAYAVQALMLAPAVFRAEIKEQLRRAAAYLNETEGEPVIPMWVGKTLYGPTQVVRSAVLSAQILLARSEHARPAD